MKQKYMFFWNFRIFLLENSFRRSWFWRLKETIHEKYFTPWLHTVNNQLVLATITPVITDTIHVFASLVEAETFIAPNRRLTPPQTPAAVSSEGSWRGSGDEGEERDAIWLKVAREERSQGKKGEVAAVGDRMWKLTKETAVWWGLDGSPYLFSLDYTSIFKLLEWI